MAALLLVAASLGLSNFAASVALGLAGVDSRLRIRVAVIFGAFEAGMPLIGLLVGHNVSRSLGEAARPLGGVLLGLTGAYAIVSALVGDKASGRSPKVPRLVVAALALSIDNLVVGFALGAYRVSLALAAVVIAIVSVAMSLLGLELGGRFGSRLGSSAELAGGVVLIGVAVAIGTGTL